MANSFKAIFFSVSALLCITLVAFALHVFPIPGTDSMVFIPPAISFSKGQGLANSLYYVTQLTDLTHTNRFNYYVPFYPFVLGLLTKVHPGIKSIFFCCALVSCVNLLLYTRLIASFLPARSSTSLKALILLSLTYLCIYLLPTVGRPENFTSLFVFAIYLLYQKRGEMNKGLYYTLITLFFAFMLSTQLICFYFCFLFYGLYSLLDARHILKNIVTNCVLFVLIAVLFCLILEITPNGLVNTVNGIRLHTNYALSRTDKSLSLFAYYWLFAPLSAGFLVIFLVACGFFVRELYQRLAKADLLRSALALLLIVAVVFGVFKFILYGAPTVYNVTEFIMPLSAYILYHIIKADTRPALQSLIRVSMLLVYVAGTVLFMRSTILFADDMKGGKDYDTAKTTLAGLTKGYNKFYVTNSLWSLVDSFDHVGIAGYTYQPGDTIVIQEAYQSFPIPAGTRYSIIYDWRSTKQEVKFMGMKIANRPNDYGFVICRIW